MTILCVSGVLTRALDRNLRREWGISRPTATLEEGGPWRLTTWVVSLNRAQSSEERNSGNRWSEVPGGRPRPYTSRRRVCASLGYVGSVATQVPGTA
eukprot:996726-Amphidinium_carterae.1